MPSGPRVDAAGVQRLERLLQAAQVVRTQGGRDVEVICRLLGAVNDARERADDDIGDVRVLEFAQQHVRVERVGCKYSIG